MSALYEEQFKSSGVAQVIVLLKSSISAGAAEQHFASCFRSAETSQITALETACSAGRGGGRGRPAAPQASPMRVYPNLGVMLGTVDPAGLNALREDTANVAAVQSAPVFSLIRPKRRSAATAKPKTRVTWGIQALGIDKAWKQGLTGKGVLVGHLDTGVDGRHPVFRKGAIGHWAFFDDFGNLDPSEKVPRDTDEHGTHTAATIAGRPFKKSGTKFHVGVAFEAQLASAAVIEGGDAVARVLGGMDWAISQGVRVLSMSLGFRGFLDDFEFLTRVLRQRNILPVFAVGNEGPGTSRSPGNYSEALSVGAADRSIRVADFSSSQRFARNVDPIVPDLVGAGVDVVSAVPNRQFAMFSGTSMATPHIAGMAALLLQAKPQATADQLERAIFASCRRPTSMLPARGNRGFPNVMRALGAL